jgi:DNA invertase Pin-like site-specific DNA recombinase
MNTLHIYARVSTKAQADKNLSIPEQINIGKRIAERNGLEVIIHEELGKSASSDNFMNRPVIGDLLSKIKNKKIKFLYAFDLTRLSRNEITQAILFRELNKNNVKLFTRNGEYNLRNTTDQLTFRLLEAVAQYDASMRVARFQLGNVSANRKGIFTKPNVPYGWKKDENRMLVINEEEKNTVLQMVEWYLNDNLGTNQIANKLNEQFILTRSAKNQIAKIENCTEEEQQQIFLQNLWNPGTVNTIFKYSGLFGERSFKVGENEEGKSIYETVTCPAIVNKKTFELLAEKRNSNAITKKRTKMYFRLLSGIVKCGTCGKPMEGRIKPSRGEYTYRCISKRYTRTSCKTRGINIFKLNNIIWNELNNTDYLKYQVNELITEKQASFSNGDDLTVLKKSMKELNSKIKSCETKLSKLIGLYAGGQFTKEMLDVEVAKVNEVKNKLVADKDELELKKEMMSSESLGSSKFSNAINDSISLFNVTVDELSGLFTDINDFGLGNDKSNKARDFILNTIKCITVKNIDDINTYELVISFKSIENQGLLSACGENLYHVLPELKKTVKVGGKSNNENQIVYDKEVLEFI